MENLFGQRLTSARKMAGLSLKDLADKMENAVTRQALNKYEKGEMLPGSTVLIRLANALSVTVDFFFSEPEVKIDLQGIEFRKKISRLSKTAEVAVIEKARAFLERYLELENLLNIPLHLSDFQYEVPVSNAADAQIAAESLRKQWNLGSDPIPSVIEMLEDHGFKVLEIDADDAFDGLKALVQGHKVIVLNKKHNAVRKRFTALHELAHHSLPFDTRLAEKDVERLCHTFASAVLYPAEIARTEMAQERFHFFLQELELIKERWGISIAALFPRALHLGIINANTYRRLNTNYRVKGYHRNEPGDFGGRERPRRFIQLLYRAIGQEVISINHAAHLAEMNLGEFRDKLEQLA
jgi:Zn-dependent peptidase ImmA (M78 family)/DNA-binding XRE family transcriptional regulator